MTMKVFAIITAAVMATAGGVYFLSSGNCLLKSDCPVATSGGCCPLTSDAGSCEVRCPGCSTDCLECCTVCEQCCTFGAQAAVETKVSATTPSDAEEECCPHCATPAKHATSAVMSGASLK
jgi:hypothetical protein